MASYEAMGIKPRNPEQEEVMEALLSKEVELVFLLGAAGTGKTLLTLAAGLDQIFNQKIYKKLMIARPLIPLGKDIGHLPGTKEEKLEPWIAPIRDNLAVIAKGREDEIAFYMDDKNFETEAVTFMRGRSLHKQFLLIDEAQNLTYLELKTILTRVGYGTKIVVLGDPAQSDVYKNAVEPLPVENVAEKMSKYSSTKVIYLKHVERSRLANQAVKAL